MKHQAEQVKVFLTAFRVMMLDKPGHLPYKEVDLNHNLLAEELREYFINAKVKQDIPNIGNELIDIIYVAIGGLIRHGFSPDLIEQMFDEVHRCNMDKTHGGEIREDGKILKPDGHKGPQIGELIEQYEKRNAF